MLLGFEELCRKEVIDISTGERLGFIDDIELDIESGSEVPYNIRRSAVLRISR